MSGETTNQQTQKPERTSPIWAVVAGREIGVKLRDRSFIIGSLMTLAILVGLIGLQAWLDSRTSSYDVVTSSPQAAALVERLVEDAPGIDEDVEITALTEDDDAAARAAVDDESADAWVTQDAEGIWTLVTRESAPDALRSVVETTVQAEVLARNADAAGTSVDELTAGTELAVRQLDGDEQLSELRDFLGFALAFMFYLASIIFGMTLAQSVTEEKQSRIVEMIAAAVPLRQLLAGKVIGNTALAVGQLTVYVAVGMLGLSLTDYGSFIPGLTGDLVWFLAFFLVGFLALACLWAVAGALASRNEDLQSTATPVTMLLLAVFLGSAFLEGRAETIGSFVPPLSAVAMPVRLINGEAQWWEAVVALGLLLALAAALVLVAERIYRRALMQSGGQLSMRQAWRLEE
ncbi:aromatic ring-opening dioxygenase LigA [Nocardioides sp. Root190]|uniref:ABC transporter permease n=1 Tax=Nocardioides sp. Root190 TaxID=1736488 RepID=UPI0006FF8781|nr:ABC transporter permease [Nocardioides sp. Root190]KRB76892.1 aromatic ring-opening dioxygenase LigA [Nocardioides sp. Root190]